MSTEHLDLENLRDITGGDTEMESMLFDEYVTSSVSLIDNLSKALENDDEEWKRAAHALKGISLTLGAEILGNFAKDAQDSYKASYEHKKTLYENIVNEHQTVLKIIETERKD